MIMIYFWLNLIIINFYPIRKNKSHFFVILWLCMVDDDKGLFLHCLDIDGEFLLLLYVNIEQFK
jgi:hypothetical protein